MGIAKEFFVYINGLKKNLKKGEKLARVYFVPESGIGEMWNFEDNPEKKPRGEFEGIALTRGEINSLGDWNGKEEETLSVQINDKGDVLTAGYINYSNAFFKGSGGEIIANNNLGFEVHETTPEVVSQRLGLLMGKAESIVAERKIEIEE